MSRKKREPETETTQPEPETAPQTGVEQPETPGAEAPAAQAPAAEPETTVVPTEELDRLRQAVARADELYNALLHKAADYENLRRRTAREKEELVGRLIDVHDLFPVLDNLERALASGEQTGEGAALAEGVRMVYDQFVGVLQRKGIERIPTENERFDPTLHEAVMTVCDASMAPNTIHSEMLPGYRRGDSVLRASRVVVAIAPPKQANAVEESGNALEGAQ